MKKVKVSELKAKLSQYLRSVQQGNEILVLDRNLPVARLLAVPEAQQLSYVDESISSASIFAELPSLSGKKTETNSLEILVAERKRR